MNPRQIFILLSLISLAGIAIYYPFNHNILWALVLVGPLIIIGLVDIFQKKHTIRRNYPVVGNIRYLLESIRPEIMQYFIENDREGRPINRLFRSLIYERSKKENDNTPFGTQVDVYTEGYEWLNHSIYAIKHTNAIDRPRVLVGASDCKKPYSACILNISAMSFGSLSKNAVMAMNKGAQMGTLPRTLGKVELVHTIRNTVVI